MGRYDGPPGAHPAHLRRVGVACWLFAAGWFVYVFPFPASFGLNVLLEAWDYVPFERGSVPDVTHNVVVLWWRFGAVLGAALLLAAAWALATPSGVTGGRRGMSTFRRVLSWGVVAAAAVSLLDGMYSGVSGLDVVAFQPRLALMLHDVSAAALTAVAVLLPLALRGQAAKAWNGLHFSDDVGETLGRVARGALGWDLVGSGLLAGVGLWSTRPGIVSDWFASIARHVYGQSDGQFRTMVFPHYGLLAVSTVVLVWASWRAGVAFRAAARPREPREPDARA